MQKLESGNYRSLTFDEISMERSKSFVKALQELKNLRPQLYSAAEYCEKSYLNSDQKQMVLDNLKDYTVRAVVNAIDHLGTVAYKLTKLFEQQSLDVSSVEIRIAGLNEKMLVCQTYTDKEGLKQHQLFVNKPRHHKHYVLPNSVSKKVRFSPLRQMDIKQNHSHDKLRPYLSDNPASRTLSWHLSTENKSSIPNSSEDAGPSNQSLRINSTFSHLTDDKKGASSMSPMANPWGGGNGLPLPSVFLESIGFSRRDSPGVMKPMSSSSYKPSDTPRWDISSTSSRNKNVFTMFFAKQKSSKQKMVNAS